MIIISKTTLSTCFSILVITIFLLITFECLREETISLSHYYDCDRNLPLNPEKELVLDRSDKTMWHISYADVHNERVTALLSFPKKAQHPMPAVIYLHGIGDHITADYM